MHKGAEPRRRVYNSWYGRHMNPKESAFAHPLRRADALSSSQTARATLLLREMVIDGHFLLGERIKEIPLAAKLGVSRIPLRLALERLAHEGLLEVRATRGFVVQQFSTSDIYDSIDLRGSLEGTAARLAAERLRDGGDLSPLRELSGLMDALFRKRDLNLAGFTSYIDLNAKFHSALLDLSRSRILRRAVKQVCSLPFASPSAFLLKQQASVASRDLFLIALDHHHGIIDAIANRESTRAEALAREHARLARRNLDLALGNRELMKAVRGAKLIEL
jgi:GntR family transcriptional regulator, vanillate catabolism transcriptional regulator